jgi:hypothetical protein
MRGLSWIGIVATGFVAAGCVSDPYTRPLSPEGRREIGVVAAGTGRESSSIVVRVAVDGEHCPAGQVRLRPFRNGLPDPDRFVTVGQVNALSDLPHAEGFGQALVKMATLNVSGLWKDWSTKDPRVSFVRVDPGEYLVTWVNCDRGNRRDWIGGDHPTLLANARYSPPVLGANLIRIRPGEIVDAGILELRTVQKAGFLTRATGRVVAHPTPEALRAAFQEAAPDAYRRMTFTTFQEWIPRS